jgi:hypothetical protein
VRSLVAVLVASFTSLPLLAGATPVAAAPEEPSIDACYDYSAPKRMTPQARARIARSAPIDCTRAHTAQTYWVGTVPESFGNPRRASGTSRARATRACTARALTTYLGLSDRTIPSRFQTITVFPSSVQWQKGQRWVRCDAILRGGRGFTPVTGPFQEFITTRDPDSLDFCTPGVPGTRTTTAYPCTKPKKNWVMIREVELGGPQKRFPGRRAVERRSKAICEKAAKVYSGGQRFHAWWGIWPTGAGWRQGDRTAQCFVPFADYLKATRTSSAG